MTGNRPVDIWLLTDRRYLEQRMPLALRDWLESAGHAVRLVVADEHRTGVEIASGLPPENGPWEDLEPGDLVVVRSRHRFALALLQVAEALGAHVVDPWREVLAVRNKVRCAAALARHGVRIPPTFLVHAPEHLERVPSSAYPLILKPVLGDNARGLRVVKAPSELASVEWAEELVLAQSYLDAGGIDLKVYVADDTVWAVRRPSPLTDADDVAAPTRPTPEIRRLAHVCRQVFGLRLFGLDVLELPGGPVVVDVNEFPNYTGVEDAPEAIGRALLETATRRSPASPRVAVPA
jgi:ribosomal protein S6--L-glutamate ligase